MNKAISFAAAVILIASMAGCSMIEAGSPAARVPPRIELFTVNPPEANAGESVLLSWSVSDNASAVTIDPGIGSVQSAGSIAVSPSQKQEYTIRASNQFGTVTSALTVNVIGEASQTPLSLPLINSFLAQPGHGPAGITVELIWDTEDADSVSIQWGDKNSLDFTGNRGSIVQQPVVSTTYMLIARNRLGVRATNVTVTVDRDLPGAGGSGNAGGSCG